MSTRATVTSQGMTDKEAITVLTKMFGKTVDQARESLVIADLSSGEWTGSLIVMVRRSPESGSFYVRYNIEN